MTINLQRAQRKTEFWQNYTPANVGPGIYDQGNASQFDHKKDATAPFHTTKDRTVGDALNSNPGAGSYVSQERKIVPKVQDKMHNSFTTKIPRFCPTAPGSGLVQGPTYQKDPDPGQYHQEKKWNDLKYLDKTLLKYKKNEHAALAVIPNAHAPSIPTKKLAATAYTGRSLPHNICPIYWNGGNQVGPAAYNPKQPTIKPQAPIYDFANSKVDRKLFAQHNMRHNDLCWAQNPGPGVYDFEKQGQKQFNSTGENQVFQSKVPNCKDAKEKAKAPGPGSYKTVVSIEKQANDHLRSNSDGQFIGQEPQSFLVKTKRGEFWKHEGETPYTRQTYAKAPGPGQYDHEKKKDDIKHRIVLEEAVHAAFNSSDERAVNKKTKAPNPGPGSYIDISNPLHCSLKTQAATWNKEDRTQQEEQGIKLGPFGSNSYRFFKSWMDPRDGPRPDPGAYAKELVRITKNEKTKYDLAIEGRSTASTRAFTAAEKERGKPNSIFQSTTDRFNSLEKTHPNVVILNPEKKHTNSTDDSKFNNSLFKGVKNVIKANEKVQYDFKDTRTQWTAKGRAYDYEAFSGKNIGFDQTSPRFNYNQVFYGQSLKFDVPGPGQYPNHKNIHISQTCMPKNKNRAMRQARPGTFQQPRHKSMKQNQSNMAVFDCQDKRFRPKGQQSYNHQAGTNQQVGPGSYVNLENSMIKKSFNMSMEHSYFL